MEKYEKYCKESEYSYCLGAYPTYELINNKSEFVDCVLLSTKIKLTSEVNNLMELCNKKGIKLIYNDKAINKISNKENCFVIGVFKKYKSELNSNKHIVLVNPSDMGNLGTIMRTMLGFNYVSLAIIKPAVDLFNPKVVRASMGAIFKLNVCEFESFDEYKKTNNLKQYLFMLNGKNILGEFKTLKQNYALVFGNEAHGLPPELAKEGETVLIKHNNKIDSLNLQFSVVISIFVFNNYVLTVLLIFVVVIFYLINFVLYF